eukprot:223305-Pelagomonas_calceolata.AAC.1
MGAATQGARHMSGPAHETPLTKIMPPLVALPRQIAASSRQASAIVVWLLDFIPCRMLSDDDGPQAGTERREPPSAPPLQASLSPAQQPRDRQRAWCPGSRTNGNDATRQATFVHVLLCCSCTCAMQAGFKRLAEAAVAKVPSMEPQQVADLVVGFHKWVQ